MRFALALVLLAAACWTGTGEYMAPEQPRRATLPRVTHVRPQCWSLDFYAEWPVEVSDSEIWANCREEWDDDPDMVWNCAGWELRRHYEQLWYWVNRWFESCDPKREP